MNKLNIITKNLLELNLIQINDCTKSGPIPIVRLHKFFGGHVPHRRWRHPNFLHAVAAMRRNCHIQHLGGTRINNTNLRKILSFLKDNKVAFHKGKWVLVVILVHLEGRKCLESLVCERRKK